MKSFIQYLLIGISLLMYAYAPVEFSYSFVVKCFLIYLLSSILLLSNNCRDSILKFEFLFILAFFFTNYAYALIFYPTNPYFSLFHLDFNETYICKGVGLSTVGITSFCAGIFNRKSIRESYVGNAVKLRNFNFLILILLIIFIPYLYSLYQMGAYTTQFESSFINAVLVYLIYYYIFYCFNNFSVGGKNTRLISYCTSPISILIIIYLTLFLLIGSRTIPLRIVLLCMILYHSYVKRISNISIISLLLLGAFVLTVIGIVREGNDFGGLTSFWHLGTDLTINNRSLFVLMEYVDRYGYTFGTSMLMQILSVIPFMQSIFLYITGMSIDDISSGGIVTHSYFGSNSFDRIGLGTNIIGDVYLAFGLIGVLIGMYLLGYIIKVLFNKSKNGNVISMLLYALFFMDVIYLPRSSILGFLRAIAWTYFIYIVYNKWLKRYFK